MLQRTTFISVADGEPAVQGASARRIAAEAPSVLSGIPAAANAASKDILSRVNVVLAPLCGITDWIYRRICLEFGADMVVTEMISSDALWLGKEPIRAMRCLDASEGPLVFQIFGADPGRMGRAAEILSTLDPFLIDLNFGCPVRKVVRGNGGAALLRDIALLGRICRAVVRKSRVPVSAKIRAGWDSSSLETIREIARVIEDSGISVITVHARTKAQAFTGCADWGLIRDVKESVSIPVVGNGDVRCPEDYFAIRERTGCDAVMIGRAAIGNPWIFAEIKARMNGVPFVAPTPRQRINVLKAHLWESVEALGEPLGIIPIRRVIAAYSKHLPGARELRGRLMSLERLDEIESVLNLYMETNGF